MINLLNLRRHHIDAQLPRRYLLVTDAESCLTEKPTLVVDTRLASLETALAFARRIDLASERKIFVPVRTLGRFQRICARIYNACMSASLQDPFCGYFITKQTYVLQQIGREPVFLLLDIMTSHLTDQEVASIPVAA